eukprot:g21109.t1
MRNLLLFMCGAVLFGIGELFKLRSVQDFPGKNLCGFDSLLRQELGYFALNADEGEAFGVCSYAFAVLEAFASHGSGVRRLGQPGASQVRQLKAQANALAFQLQRPQSSGAGETDPLNETEDGHGVCQSMQYNFGHLNFWRVVWAAVFQLAGVALWVPASLPELMPCLHQTSTWSVAKWMVTDAVDESEIISFGSVCAMHLGVTSSVVSERSELQALVAILCLVFALFLIPYELHVYSPFNPYNWPVKIKFLQEHAPCVGEGAIESQHWLRLIVDGVFLAAWPALVPV